ncbi:MAG: hypothetical protein KC656_04340 [Myxococcales bacterium]|nr:hypothetical protein [Myxococcales bacterium]
MIALLLACGGPAPPPAPAGPPPTLGPGSEDPFVSALAWRDAATDHEAFLFVSTAQRICADVRASAFRSPIEERSALVRMVRAPGSDAWRVADITARKARGQRGEHPVFPEGGEVLAFDVHAGAMSRVRLDLAQGELVVSGIVEAAGCGDEGVGSPLPVEEIGQLTFDGAPADLRGAILLPEKGAVRLVLSTGPMTCSALPRADLKMSFLVGDSPSAWFSGAWIDRPDRAVQVPGSYVSTLGDPNDGRVPVRVSIGGDGARVRLEGTVSALDCREPDMPGEEG